MHAIRGATTLVRTQRHAKVHFVATVVVLGLGAAFRISTVEWALVVLAVAMVWLSEAMNTAIEFLSDEVSLEWRERIKHAKDVAAFAVLAAAIAAATIGVLVFSPYVASRFQKMPNKAPEPTPTSVMPRATSRSSEGREKSAFLISARVMPDAVVAHL